ncbi:MAG: hypothetical protein KDN05_02930 [Verrucomicrobiae bacterium]|nr:hypothetical protein [Verrucomicrobiae bacterium]
MSSRRKSFNFKRRFATTPPDAEALVRLAGRLDYGGNPAHKRNPGDFGLTPPAQPRDDKSHCDTVLIFNRSEALRLLKKGVEKGMISEWDGTGFPKNIWSMTSSGYPLEAQLENSGKGTYHGYPLDENDDFRDAVIAKWKQLHE